MSWTIYRWVLYTVRGKNEFHSSCWCPFFSVQIIEGAILCPLHVSDIFIKICFLYLCGIMSRSSILAHWSCACFIPIIYGFYYYGSAESLKSCDTFFHKCFCSGLPRGDTTWPGPCHFTQQSRKSLGTVHWREFPKLGSLNLVVWSWH